MDDEMRRRFDGMQERFDTIQSRFDTIQGRFDGVEERFERLEALMIKVRADLMARMHRLQDAAGRDREDVRLASGAAQAAHKSALQLLEMTTVLHRRLTNAEQAIEDLRKPPEAA